MLTSSLLSTVIFNSGDQQGTPWLSKDVWWFRLLVQHNYCCYSNSQNALFKVHWWILVIVCLPANQIDRWSLLKNQLTAKIIAFVLFLGFSPLNYFMIYTFISTALSILMCCVNTATLHSPLVLLMFIYSLCISSHMISITVKHAKAFLMSSSIQLWNCIV